MQSKLQSFIESLVNVAVGFFIGVAAQAFIFPVFGLHVTLGENMLMGVFFTLVSIVRSYILRRAFNAYHLRQYHKSRD